MIDEKKLLDDIKNLKGLKQIKSCTYSKSGNTLLHNLAMSLVDEVVNIINKQPKVNEWISVEENLPTRGVNVLVSYRSIYCEYEDGSCDYFMGTDIDIAKYIDGEWYSSYDDDFDGKILAWMPLPKAYEGEINNEK